MTTDTTDELPGWFNKFFCMLLSWAVYLLVLLLLGYPNIALLKKLYIYIYNKLVALKAQSVAEGT